jgi:hypothetical protein
MDRLQDAACFEIRIVLDLGGVQRGAGRYSDPTDQLHRLLLGVLTRPLADGLIELHLVLEAHPSPHGVRRRPSLDAIGGTRPRHLANLLLQGIYRHTKTR